jgi:hypothetical protein
MASVLDRPLFQKNATERVARERLNKLGNIQDYASQGMFGVGGTMEDTGIRYQQPFGYSEGQVDPGILGAVRQRALRGSQIVQGGEYTNRDVPDLRARFQASRNDLLQQIEDAQVSSDPSKYEVIKALKGKLAELDQTRDQLLEKASGITYTAEDKYGMLSGVGAGTPDVPEPMGPGEMDIFQSISERAAAENLKQEPPVFGGAPAQKPVVTAAEAQIQNQSGPSGMEMEARKLPKDAQGVQKGPTGMEAEVLGRKGSITPADVAAALNDPKPEVREKTAADFAKQFTDMGPKYEGIDKGLLLAQIGFAIAAGESPNAMKNIADGLSLGADTAIKDKAAKAEFDRQIQLSAMQYGLGEAGKLEAEKRAMSREGKAGDTYVATKNMEYNGRKYVAGDNVFVPNSQLWESGLPEGLSTETSNNALLTTQASVQKALIEARNNNVISGSEYKDTLEGLNNAASTYSSATSSIPILEGALDRLANGEVVGLAPTLETWWNDFANAAGLEPKKGYADQDAYNNALKSVAVKMVGSIIGEANSKNITENDRIIMNQLVGILNDTYANLTMDPDEAAAKIQSLMGQIETQQRKALADYQSITESVAGVPTRSGAQMRSVYADSVFATPKITATLNDEGVWVLSPVGE